MTHALSPRFVAIPSAGSLPVVLDRKRQTCVEHGRRFQPTAARAEADRLNAADCAIAAKVAP